MTESVAGTYRADLGSLATLGAVKFNDGISGLLTTAHPTLMEDGTLINITNGVCSSSQKNATKQINLVWPIKISMKGSAIITSFIACIRY